MNKVRYLIVIALVISITVGWKAFTLYQATLANAISQWDSSDENNFQAIDHSLWQGILTKYVKINADNSHAFDYANVSVNDQSKLGHYLTQLQKIDPRDYRKNEQLAYWVNLYNALIIDLVLKHYPLESVKEIGDGFTGPWNLELATVANTPISLNNIEHGILRPLWQDMRIHYVINCASIGCPDLPKKALSSTHIDAQLNAAAKRFINQKKAIDFGQNKLVLSSIYDWFSVDFGASQAMLFKHLIDYADLDLKQQLIQFKNTPEYAYNWKLNEPSAGLHVSKNIANTKTNTSFKAQDNKLTHSVTKQHN